MALGVDRTPAEPTRPTSPGEYLASIAVSGVLWSAAFALYFVRYWPILTRPRLDGRPG